MQPKEAVAKVSGVSYFGFVIGPPLIGFIADAFELRWTLMLLAGLSYLLILRQRLHAGILESHPPEKSAFNAGWVLRDPGKCHGIFEKVLISCLSSFALHKRHK